MAGQTVRGCWTCKDRRVRCDRTLPHCRTCSKTKRHCLGYGLRLSWPRDHDPKRSLLGPAPAMPQMRKRQSADSTDEDDMNSRRLKSYWFIHTSSGDVKVYHDAAASRQTLHSWLSFINLQWTAPPETPLIWSALDLGDGGKPLMQYFYTIAYTSIPSFSAFSKAVRGLLVRMAFSNNGLPAQALRHGMLAVASVHRGDPLAVYTRYKGLALRALSESVNAIDVDAGEAARHVAGVMLLSSLYIQPCYTTGNEWLTFLSGAREVIKRSRFGSMMCDTDDVSELMDWVYHHDVFSRFTSFHWRRGEGNPYRRLDEVPEYQMFTHPLRHLKQGRQVLGIFHGIFDVMMYPAAGESSVGLRPEVDMDRLTRLREVVEGIAYVDPVQHGPDSTDAELDVGGDAVPWREDAAMPGVFELYRLSALLCLARTGESRFGWRADTEGILDRAMAVMRGMDTCQRQFPVLVLGSQAKSEEQRRVVIDLLARSKESAAGRALACLQKSIEFSWVQADLHADEELLLDFGQLMRTLCGNCLSVPNLA